MCTTPSCLWSTWSSLEIKLHQFVPLYYNHIADKEFLIKVPAVLMVNNSRHTQLEVCSQSRNISVRGRQCFQHLEFVRNPTAVSTGCSKNYPGLSNIGREMLFEECKHNIGYLYCSVSGNLKTTTHCGVNFFKFCVEKYFYIQKIVFFENVRSFAICGITSTHIIIIIIIIIINCKWVHTWWKCATV